MPRFPAAPLVVAAWLAACATVDRPPPRPQGPPPPVAFERVERDLPVPDAQARIRIDNPFGDVHVRNSNAPAVGVEAVVQRVGVAAPRVDVDVEAARGGARVAVSADGLAGMCADLLPGGWRRARADVTVFVPRGSQVDVRTGCDGRVTARNIKGSVTVRSAAGSIEASATGRLDLESGSGLVRVRLTTGKWPGTSRIVSRTGPVALTVPVFGNVALDVRGCGTLRTELDLDREERRGGCWRARQRYGTGAHPLHVESGGPFVEIHPIRVPAG